MKEMSVKTKQLRERHVNRKGCQTKMQKERARSEEMAALKMWIRKTGNEERNVQKKRGFKRDVKGEKCQ